MKTLTERQRRFVDEYIASGSAYSACLKAGYSEKYAKAQSHLLLENVGIKQQLEKRQKELNKKKIATMEEIQEFWANTVRNPQEDMKNRLKASEYIAKTKGAFLEKQEISVTGLVQFTDDIDSD